METIDPQAALPSIDRCVPNLQEPYITHSSGAKCHYYNNTPEASVNTAIPCYKANCHYLKNIQREHGRLEGTCTNPEIINAKLITIGKTLEDITLSPDEIDRIMVEEYAAAERATPPEKKRSPSLNLNYSKPSIVKSIAAFASATAVGAYSYLRHKNNQKE